MVCGNAVYKPQQTNQSSSDCCFPFILDSPILDCQLRYDKFFVLAIAVTAISMRVVTEGFTGTEPRENPLSTLLINISTANHGNRKRRNGTISTSEHAEPWEGVGMD